MGVGILLTLWRVNRWVIIWSLLKRFQVSFGCVWHFIIKLVIFMHEGQCRELLLLALIIEMQVVGMGTVTSIGLRICLLCNWLF
jgi:hypothetical protein